MNSKIKKEAKNIINHLDKYEDENSYEANKKSIQLLIQLALLIKGYIAGLDEYEIEETPIEKEIEEDIQTYTSANCPCNECASRRSKGAN